MDSAAREDRESAPLLLTFFVALPVPCPLQHGSVVSRLLEETLRGWEDIEVRATDGSFPLDENQRNRNFVSLKFWQLKETVDVADSLHGLLQVVHEVTGLGEAPEERVPLSQDTYRTVVEMVTAQNGDTLSDMDSALREAFARCFSVLYDVYSLSRLAKRDNITPHVGAEQAGVVFWFGRFAGEEYGNERGGTFWLSPPVHYPDEVMDEKEFEQLLTMLQRVWNGSPLELVMGRSLVASQYMDQQGDYANAVIHAALASEILLDSLLGLLLWEEQIEAPDFQAALIVFDESKNGGLASRIKREYGPRLGGNWNPAANGPVRRWSEDLAYMRGRVVHRGYRPSRAEAEKAIAASDKLLEFVKARLALRAERYPRTCLMILGEPGLRRIGGWKWARKFLESTEEHPLSWFSGYSTWRDTVDSMRSSI
ncbi:hypothetical protein [Streptomyces recifensis]|uniref:hypothetical protein n=1 Tax=Streptomyces recifensis TaxID=67355 RepID=UPI0011245A46|nr:hypothetical protein [Streptomyces recifensis]